jgi:hypothetical protein
VSNRRKLKPPKIKRRRPTATQRAAAARNTQRRDAAFTALALATGQPAPAATGAAPRKAGSARSGHK